MDIPRVSYNTMLNIFIDADGCPVVYHTLDIAAAYGVPCIIVCDSAHVFQIDGVQTLTVDQGRDSADYKILNSLHANDVVITQDYGLAAMALAKGAFPISQNGVSYTNDNIDGMLAQRHFSAKQRKATHRYPHIKKRTSQQDEMFEEALKKLLDCIVS